MTAGRETRRTDPEKAADPSGDRALSPDPDGTRDPTGGRARLAVLLISALAAAAACGGGDGEDADGQDADAVPPRQVADADDAPETDRGDDVVTVRRSALELTGLTVVKPRPDTVARTATLVGRLERDPALTGVVRSPMSGQFRIRVAPGRSVAGGDTVGWVSSPETYPDSLPLTAPVAGDVLDLPEGRSGLVEAWSPVAEVASTDTLRLVLPVPPDLYGTVREGTVLRVARADAAEESPRRDPGRRLRRGLPVRVTGFLEPEAEASRLRAVGRLAAAGTGLEPGMRVTVTARLEEEVAGHWVPGAAVLYDRRRPGRTVAYLRDGDAYRQVSVEVARRTGDSAFVASGLASGDRVVGRGAYQLLYADFSFRGIGAEAGEMEEGEEDEGGP